MLHLGGGVDTATPMGSMLFTIMVTLKQRIRKEARAHS